MGPELVLGILGLAFAGLLWWITEAKLDVPRELFAWIGTICLSLIASTIAVPSLRWFYGRKRREVPMLLVILTGALSGAVLGYIAWTLSAKKYEIEKINSQTEPQSTVPAPIAKPSEPAPPFHEKVEPAPTPVPRKANPPVTKKGVPIKPKEIIPDKPDKPIETAPIEATPIPPNETASVKLREKIASVLIKKYTELPPTIVDAPDRFIPKWIKRIDIVRIDTEKRHLRPDLQRLMRESGGPPRVGPTVKEFVDDAVAEATFTLGCLEREGYIQITKTAAQGSWYAIGFPNWEFEFVPERRDEFIAGL